MAATLIHTGSPCGLTGLAFNSVAVLAPPLSSVLGDVAVILGVADRTIDELSNEIGVTGVAEGLGDDVNEHMVQVHGLVAPPRHGTRGVEFQCLDRRVRGLARLAIVIDYVVPRFVCSHEEVRVVFCSIFEPEIRLTHRSAKDGTEIAELDEGQVFYDSEEVGPTRYERTSDVVFRQPVQFPNNDVTTGLQIATQDTLHGATRYAMNDLTVLLLSDFGCRWPDGIVTTPLAGSSHIFTRWWTIACGR
jgi:hypothetical protein